MNVRREAVTQVALSGHHPRIACRTTSRGRRAELGGALLVTRSRAATS